MTNTATTALAGTPTGRVIHAATADEATGEAVTDCGRRLPMGWQEFDAGVYGVTCRPCAARLRAAEVAANLPAGSLPDFDA